MLDSLGRGGWRYCRCIAALARTAGSDETSFPSANIQLLGEGFYMNKRPGSDSPKVSKVSWLAAEGLEGRLVTQSCVRSSVAHVRCRKEEFSPQKGR